jgi:hypothetical protein
MADQVERTLAQFFFEVGFGACWAEAYIANGETPPFALTDAGVERAWEIAGEAHDDPEEFDRNKALADAASDLLAACEFQENILYLPGDPADLIQQVRQMRRAAIAKARTSTDGGRDG